MLFVVHSVSASGNVGGVELYVDAMRRALRERFEILTWAFDGARGDVCALYDEHGAVVERTVFGERWDRMTLVDAAKERRFDELLIAHRIALVHFQHLLGQPWTLPAIARGRGVPALATFQDYWPICDSYNLLDYRERYCDVPHRDRGICELCTQRRIGKPRDAQRVRRRFVRLAFAALDAIVFDSPSSHELHAGVYPELAGSAKCAVLPLPLLEPLPERASRRRPPRAPGAPLTVAALGNFTVEKGADAFLIAAESLRDQPIAFTVIGRVQPRIAARIAREAAPNVSVLGDYRREAVGAALRDVDLSCHLSIWPETYCMALSEAWASGCVPIVSALGALAERVADGVNGFVVAPDDAAELAALLRRIVRSPGLLDALRANVKPSLWFGEGEHADAIAGRYAALLAHDPARARRAHAANPRPRCAGDYGCGTDGEAGGDPIELDLVLVESPEPHALDDLCGEGPCEQMRIAPEGSVALTGWFRPGEDGDQRIWVALESEEGGASVLIPATPQLREDVAAFLDDPRALASGFRAVVRAGRLAPGTYVARAARPAGPALRATPPLARIEVAAAPAAAERGIY